MTIYVDALADHGWLLRGKPARSCHLFSDGSVQELRAFGFGIGMHANWLQMRSVPHFDLTQKRRAAAIAAGAVEVDYRTAVEIWRALRQREVLPRPARLALER